MYGKSTGRYEVKAATGPIPPEELAAWSDERIAVRLKELEATSRQGEDG